MPLIQYSTVYLNLCRVTFIRKPEVVSMPPVMLEDLHKYSKDNVTLAFLILNKAMNVGGALRYSVNYSSCSRQIFPCFSP